MARRRCLYDSYFFIKYNGVSYDGAFTVSSFDATGGTQQIEINSYKPWSVLLKPQWLTMSAESGKRGSTLVMLTAENNAGPDGKTGSIVIATNTGKYSINMSVSQDQPSPGPVSYYFYFGLSGENTFYSVTVDSAETETSVPYRTNYENLYYTQDEWISGVVFTENLITATFPENPIAAQRQGNVIVLANGEEVGVYSIAQRPKYESVYMYVGETLERACSSATTADTYYDYTGGSGSFVVKTSYTVQEIEGMFLSYPQWSNFLSITSGSIADAGSYRTFVVNYVLDENTGNGKYNTCYIISGVTALAQMYIYQDGSSCWVSKFRIMVPQTGGTYQFTIISRVSGTNSPWHTSYTYGNTHGQDLEEFINVSPTTGNNGDVMTVVVSPNPGSCPRGERWNRFDNLLSIFNEGDCHGWIEIQQQGDDPDYDGYVDHPYPPGCFS